MHKKFLKSLIFGLMLILPMEAAAAWDYRDMDPAPADRSSYVYKREPGQFKHTKYGLIDPTPDVISLTYLPVDAYGFVDWSEALRQGLISPRDSISGSRGRGQRPAGDILIRSKMDFMPDVLFPHSSHTAWLKCSNCHPKIFKKKAGANPISMTAIWKGRFCGRCHDHVAFPIRNCFKCHSVKRNGVKR